MSSIILDCDLMKFPHSGLYHYCQNLAKHINMLLAAENQSLMKMYLPPRRKLSLIDESYHVVERKWHKLFQPFLKECLVWHAPFQSGRIIPDKRRYPNIKVVLTIHDLNVLHEGKSEACQRQSLVRTQALIDQSDAVVCISEFTKNDVLTHCDVGSKPVHVIYNGLNKAQEATNGVSSYKPNREFLLGIGYLNKKKNFHVLLPLLQSNPDLELILLGHHDDPDYVNQMNQQAQTLNVSDRLHLLGPVSEPDKIWYLRHCKAFLHPSLAEGFGFPVLEAMQFGKPVFISRLTSLPEVGGKVAFYLPDFTPDAIQTTFRQGMQTYETSNMQHRIIEQAERFSWNKSADQYLSIYRSFM